MFFGWSAWTVTVTVVTGGESWARNEIAAAIAARAIHFKAAR